MESVIEKGREKEERAENDRRQRERKIWRKENKEVENSDRD